MLGYNLLLGGARIEVRDRPTRLYSKTPLPVHTCGGGYKDVPCASNARAPALSCGMRAASAWPDGYALAHDRTFLRETICLSS